MNDHDLQREIDRAGHAERLLNDQLLQEALAAIEQDTIKAWGECPTRDKEGKEALWQLYKTAQLFRSLLQGYVETGKLAAYNLEHAGRPGPVRKILRAL